MMNEPPTYLDSLTRLSYEIPDSFTDVTFELFDVSGRGVIARELQQSIQNIQSSELSSGLYFYRVRISNKLIGSSIRKDNVPVLTQRIVIAR